MMLLKRFLFASVILAYGSCQVSNEGIIEVDLNAPRESGIWTARGNNSTAGKFFESFLIKMIQILQIQLYSMIQLYYDS